METSTDYANYKTQANFIGWYIASAPEAITCAVGTWTTSGKYGDCRQTATYDIATSCYRGNSVVRGTKTVACAPDKSCDFFRVFSTVGQDGLYAVSRYGCFNNWAANSIYRTLPAEYLATTTTGTDSSPTDSASITSPASSSTTTSTNESSTPTGTGGTASSSSSNSGLSGGAIAGIVVGCVAAGVILALLVVFRRKLFACFGYTKAPGENSYSWAPVYVPPQTQSTSQSQQMSELSAQQVHELPGPPGPGSGVAELR
ncbi:uncharacterized protein N7515_003263 [Penicillium bovifimosum]|uniref:Uncharacterized protein n=1 Tax=Penicillium bovifimosum TaxID=126998 RepID=A0A9W9H4C1_9EURO|nr:uncharacterized protein N7515_003263 [Penicillium bovifimosum]KAJ5138415.1 hypothetical protein N7515_003263 [Penicillium bovifimosum]